MSEFKDTVMLQLSELPGLKARAMFGGYGLYSANLIFGLIAGEELYFYTGPGNVPDYEELGMPLFEPFPGTFMKHYHRVPPDLLGSARQLQEWARKAIEESAKVPRKKSKRSAASSKKKKKQRPSSK